MNKLNIFNSSADKNVLFLYYWICKKNVTDQKQTSKIFMLFILIWHHPSPELMTGLPHLTMSYFSGHQWWIVSTCPLQQCQVACSRCLVISDPVLQCCHPIPTDHQWSWLLQSSAAVIVTLSVLLQCQWSRLLQYLHWCSIERTSYEDCCSWLRAEPWHRNATEALNVAARKQRH